MAVERFRVLVKRMPLTRFRGFLSCRSGATAIEFAFVIGPILTLLIGIVDFSLIAWRSSTLHTGVLSLQSAIQQKVANGSNYKSLFCDAAGPLVSCDGDLSIVVQPLRGYVTSPSGNGSNVSQFSVSLGEPFAIEATYRHKMLTPFIDNILPGRVTESRIVVYAHKAGL